MNQYRTCIMLMAALVAVEATAGTIVDGWVTDAYPATYVSPPPESAMGSAHLPALVRATVNENQIAVRGQDIFTPERDEILLSMLLSTTWESPMEPWQGRSEWLVSTFEMPMSDGSQWRLWYRSTCRPFGFELGAPRFLSPDEVPHYVVTDQQQRQWSFAQPLIAVPEPPALWLLATSLAGAVAWQRHRILRRRAPLRPTRSAS